MGDLTEEERIAAERVAAIIDHLLRVYTPQGVGAWLCGTNRRLPDRARTIGFRKPLDLLREGDIDGVVAILPALEQTAS